MSDEARCGVRVEDVYRHRSTFDPRLSPDGRRVAYVLTSSDAETDRVNASIWVAPVDGSAPPRRFSRGTRDHSPRWSPDGRYLAFASRRGNGAQILVAPLDGGESFKVSGAPLAASDPVWSPDGTRIAYAARDGDAKRPQDRRPSERAAPRVVTSRAHKLDGIGALNQHRTHIRVIEVESGAETRITEGDWNDHSPDWSPDGSRIAFVSDREPARHDRHFRADVWVVPAEGGRAQKVTRSEGCASQPTFSPDGRSIAFVGSGDPSGGPWWASDARLMLVSADGRTPPRSLTDSLDRPVSGLSGMPLATGRAVAWTPDGGSLLFLAADRGTQVLHRVELESGAVKRIVDGELQISSFDLSPSGRDVAFAAAWLDRPSEIWVKPLSNGVEAVNLSRANVALLRERSLARARRFAFRSSDGAEIEAFALLPPGFESGRRHPAVLSIHGGPHGLHPNLFPWIDYQALAAAGYVVLMPNPRGSISYGEDFTRAVVGDWGGGDYQDLIACVDAAIDRGWADPERLYVEGYSYGGFMTAWIVGHTDRFRAATIGAPCADLVSIWGTTDVPDFFSHEMMGSPHERLEDYLERSPLTHLSNARTPCLIVHWEGDLRCPIGQAEQTFQTLRASGVDATLVRYPGGSHAVRTPSQQVDLMRRARDWYQAHGSDR